MQTLLNITFAIKDKLLVDVIAVYENVRLRVGPCDHNYYAILHPHGEFHLVSLFTDYMYVAFHNHVMWRFHVYIVFAHYCHIAY